MAESWRVRKWFVCLRSNDQNAQEKTNRITIPKRKNEMSRKDEDRLRSNENRERKNETQKQTNQ